MFRPTCQVKSRATCASFQMARRQASLFDNNQSCDLTCVCHRGPFMPPAHNPEYAYKRAGRMSQNHMICCCYSNRSQQWALARWRTPSQRAGASWSTRTNTRAAGLRMLLRAQGYRLQRREWISTSDLFLDACVHVCAQKTSVLDICETEVYILVVLSQNFFICLIGNI